MSFVLSTFPGSRKIKHWNTTQRTQQRQCPRHDRPAGHLINRSRPTWPDQNCHTQCRVEKRIRARICALLAKDRWILVGEALHFGKHVGGQRSEDKSETDTLGDCGEQNELLFNWEEGAFYRLPPAVQSRLPDGQHFRRL